MEGFVSLALSDSRLEKFLRWFHLLKAWDTFVVLLWLAPEISLLHSREKWSQSRYICGDNKKPNFKARLVVNGYILCGVNRWT
jgi:hypothetical protein